MSRPRAAGWAALAVGLLLVLTGCGAGASAGGGSGEQRFVSGDGTLTTYAAGERRAVPELRGTTLDGEPFDLADHRGQVVLVNVWGSWCAPCRAEAPALERVWRAAQPAGVQFVGLNVKDRPAAARAFVDTFGITYPSIDDSSGAAQLALRGLLPGAIPSTIVVDRDGRLAAAIFGGAGEPELRRALEAALGEPVPPAGPPTTAVPDARATPAVPEPAPTTAGSPP